MYATPWFALAPTLLNGAPTTSVSPESATVLPKLSSAAPSFAITLACWRGGMNVGTVTSGASFTARIVVFRDTLETETFDVLSSVVVLKVVRVDPLVNVVDLESSTAKVLSAPGAPL